LVAVAIVNLSKITAGYILAVRAVKKACGILQAFQIVRKNPA
jgi:hypothetical protein